MAGYVSRIEVENCGMASQSIHSKWLSLCRHPLCTVLRKLLKTRISFSSYLTTLVLKFALSILSRVYCVVVLIMF